MDAYSLGNASRKGSMTSSISSYSCNNNIIRSTSTVSITNMDTRFVKKPLKKVSSTLLTQEPPEMSSSSHSSGEFLFPNGEVFRPRTNPPKRVRALKKVNTQKRSLNVINTSLTPSEEHDQRSLVTPKRFGEITRRNISSVPSSPVPNTYRMFSPPMGPHLTKAKMSNSSRAGVRHSSLDSKSTSRINQTGRPFQMDNYGRDGIYCGSAISLREESSIGPDMMLSRRSGTSSDSNLSSVFNVPRSASATPQTSISTSSEETNSNETTKSSMFCDCTTNLADESNEKSIDENPALDMPIIFEIPKDAKTNEVIKIENEGQTQKPQMPIKQGLKNNEIYNEIPNTSDDLSSTETAGTEERKAHFVDETGQIDQESKASECTLHDEHFVNDHGSNITDSIKGSINHTEDQDVVYAYEKVHDSSTNMTRGDSPGSSIFEYEVTEQFDSFLKDKQKDVPKRGDVEVLGNHIRKHRRSSSSINSNKSILPSDAHSRVPSSENPSLIGTVHSATKIYAHEGSVSHKYGHYLSNDIQLHQSKNEKQIGSSVDGKNSSTASEGIESPKNTTDSSSKIGSLVSDDTMKEEIKTDQIEHCPDLDMNGNMNVSNNTAIRSMLLDDTFSPSSKVEEFVKTASNKQMPSLQKETELKNAMSAPKLVSSPSVSKFKSFLRKLKTEPTYKNDASSQISSSDNSFSTISSSRRSRFKRSLSMSSFLNVLSKTSSNNGKSSSAIKESNRKDKKLQETNQLAPCSSEESTESPLLPVLEETSDLYTEMIVDFDKKLKVDEDSSPKHKKSIDELFIRDDELSKDQIKDQQIKDNLNSCEEGEEEEVTLQNEEDFESASIEQSDEEYIDDNIIYLRNDFVVFGENHDDKGLNDKYFVGNGNKIDNSGVSSEGMARATISITDGRFKILNQSSDINFMEVRSYLKHVRQFKDFNNIEVHLCPHILGKEGSSTEKNSQGSILRKDRSLTHKNVKFSSSITIGDTFSPSVYKRYNKSVTQYTLTDMNEINNIKTELNEYKYKEMQVHERSRQYTQFLY